MQFISLYADEHWHYPSQLEIAKYLKLSRARVNQLIKELVDEKRIPTCPTCKKKGKTRFRYELCQLRQWKREGKQTRHE